MALITNLATSPPYHIHAFIHNMGKDIPKVAEVVCHWMPKATEEEQIKATVNLRNYLAVAYRIVLRLEAEGKLQRPKKEDTKNN